MTWVHWVLYNIPPATTGLAEGVSSLPQGTLQAKNDWNRQDMVVHLLQSVRIATFTNFYALDKVLPDLGASANKVSLVNAMKGHILGQVELIGTYKKGGGASS